MQKLRLSDWAHIAEITASIVVVASLVYVGFEVNQNTKTLQNESHMNVISLLNDQQMALTTDESLYQVFITAEEAPFDLSNEDWLKFVQFIYPRIGVWEYLYIAKEEGTINDHVWYGFEPYFLSIICKPGYLRWWDEYGTSNAPQFIAYVESQVLPMCSES
ncbi:MAG: hypothetical protein GWN13_23795 [Phycisphaerae bacterium]|nr:hypothetical protein [Phycisphaerae bacterium]NIX01207.1 hypothetical protein [Phycisphaerae bacterium]